MTDIAGNWKNSNKYGSENIEISSKGFFVYKETVVVPGEYGCYDENIRRGHVQSENGKGIVTWEDNEQWPFQYQINGDTLTLLWADGSQQEFYR